MERNRELFCKTFHLRYLSCSEYALDVYQMKVKQSKRNITAEQRQKIITKVK